MRVNLTFSMTPSIAMPSTVFSSRASPQSALAPSLVTCQKNSLPNSAPRRGVVRTLEGWLGDSNSKHHDRLLSTMLP